MCLIIIDLKKEQLQGDEVSYQYTKVLIIYSHFAITFIDALDRKQVNKKVLISIYQFLNIYWIGGARYQKKKKKSIKN